MSVDADTYVLLARSAYFKGLTPMSWRQRIPMLYDCIVPAIFVRFMYAVFRFLLLIHIFLHTGGIRIFGVFVLIAK